MARPSCALIGGISGCNYRLQELAEQESGLSNETRHTALEAAQVMWEAEESLTSLWS